VAAMNEDNLKLLSKYRMLCRNKGLTKETIKAFDKPVELVGYEDDEAGNFNRKIRSTRL
jgi:hypothetical protein